MTTAVDKEEARKRLTPLQWHVTQEKGTERWERHRGDGAKLEVLSVPATSSMLLTCSFTTRTTTTWCLFRLRWSRNEIAPSLIRFISSRGSVPRRCFLDEEISREAKYRFRLLTASCSPSRSVLPRDSRDAASWFCNRQPKRNVKIAQQR